MTTEAFPHCEHPDIPDVAKRYARSYRTRRKVNCAKLCGICARFNALEMAYFCTCLLGHFSDIGRAMHCIGEFHQRIGWTVILSDKANYIG